MKKTLIIAACLSSCLPLMAQEASIKVQARSLNIQFEEINEQWNRKDKGASVDIHLQYAADDGIISYQDKNQKKLNIKATDSTGKDLGPVRLGMFFPGKDSEEGIALPLVIKTLPSTGSTSISLDGSLPVLLSTGNVVTEPQLLALKNGGEIKLGDMTVKVESTQGTELKLNLAYSSSIPPFALVFKDKDGKDIEVEERGSMRSNFGGKVSESITFELDSARTEVKIALDTWKNSKTVSVPVKMKVGLGGEEK